MTQKTSRDNLEHFFNSGPDQERRCEEIRSRINDITRYLNKQTDSLEELIELRRIQAQQQDKEWLAIAVLIICIVGIMMAGMAYLAFLNDNLSKAREDLDYYSKHAIHVFNQLKIGLEGLGYSHIFEDDVSQDEVDNVDGAKVDSSEIPF